MKKIIIAIAALASSTSASAAFDWCRLAAAAPSHRNSFENIVAAVETWGCSPRPANLTTAHFSSYVCAGDAGSRILVHVIRAVESGNMVVLAAAGDLYDLDMMARCPGASSNGRRPFVRESMLVRDQLTFSNAPGLSATWTAFRSETFGVVAAAFGGSSAGHGRALENMYFGTTRPTAPTTHVEVAGVNIINGRASAVVSALQNRGARVISQESPEDPGSQQVVLTPPVGLEGVTEVSLTSYNDHVEEVTYKLAGLAEYMAYVAILDRRYGRSDVQTVTSGSRRGCRDRFWESGSSNILGVFCGGTYHIHLMNTVVGDQLDQWQRTRTRDREPPASRRGLVVDPDNL